MGKAYSVRRYEAEAIKGRTSRTGATEMAKTESAGHLSIDYHAPFRVGEIVRARSPQHGDVGSVRVLAVKRGEIVRLEHDIDPVLRVTREWFVPGPVMGHWAAETVGGITMEQARGWDADPRSAASQKARAVGAKMDHFVEQLATKAARRTCSGRDH